MAVSVTIQIEDNVHGTLNPIPVTATTFPTSSAFEPQFRYIYAIYDNTGSAALTELKVYPNEDGVGVLNVSSIISDYLDYEINFDLTGSENITSSVRKFWIQGGAQYGTSYSSSLQTDYSPITAQENINLGYKRNPNSVGPTNHLNAFYTNHPQITYPSTYSQFPDTSILLQKSDYHTLSLINGTFNNVTIDWLTSTNSVVYTQTLAIAPENIGSPTSEVSGIGIGPQNLINFNPAYEAYFDDTSVDKVRITYDWASIGLPPSQYYEYNLAGRDNDTQCGDDYIRFAFVNYYGMWDYYSIYNPVRKTTQVNRSFYVKDNVPYEGYTDFPRERTLKTTRGNTQYKTDYTDIYEVTTDYLSSMTSEWLKELFESPEVFIIEGNTFTPVNVLNTQVERSTDTFRNKLFQYTIQFKYANDRQSR